MPIELYQQVGHYPSWNRESFADDKVGTGLIFSPVHQQKGNLESAVDASIKKHSLFDPQYYLPGSQKPKLASYPFFPETISGDGFSTLSYHTLALQSAELCIDFQIEQDFSKIVIPLRYIDQMLPDYVEQQEAFSLHPFLEVLAKKAVDKEYLLTLPITSHMVESKIFRNQILNWITKYPEIDGIYLICSFERESKQIQSAEHLLALLEFVDEIKKTGLSVVIGYQNTESLLFTLVDGVALSMGTFENTRMFSLDKFLVSDDERRGPKARIYLSGLLNWVQFEQAKTLRSTAPAVWEKVYRSTKYAEEAFSKPIDPTFNQPGLYKHHFICIAEQISKLGAVGIPTRYKFLCQWISDAKKNYASIAGIPLPIEKHGNSGHLDPWQLAIEKFYLKH